MAGNAPWFKMNHADYLIDPNLNAVSLEAQGGWMRLICHMHHADDPTIVADIRGMSSRMGVDIESAERVLRELAAGDVGEVYEFEYADDEDGVGKAWRAHSPRVAREIASRMSEADRKARSRAGNGDARGTQQVSKKTRRTSTSCPDDQGRTSAACPRESKKKSKSREEERELSPPTPSRSPDTTPDSERAPHAGKRSPSAGAPPAVGNALDQTCDSGIDPDRLFTLGPDARTAFSAIATAYPKPARKRSANDREIGRAACAIGVQADDGPLTYRQALGVLLDRVKAYAASPLVAETEAKFIPDLSNWLSEGQWATTADEWATATKSGGKPAESHRDRVKRIYDDGDAA